MKLIYNCEVCDKTERKLSKSHTMNFSILKPFLHIFKSRNISILKGYAH